VAPRLSDSRTTSSSLPLCRRVRPDVGGGDIAAPPLRPSRPVRRGAPARCPMASTFVLRDVRHLLQQQQPPLPALSLLPLSVLLSPPVLSVPSPSPSVSSPLVLSSTLMCTKAARGPGTRAAPRSSRSRSCPRVSSSSSSTFTSSGVNPEAPAAPETASWRGAGAGTAARAARGPDDSTRVGPGASAGRSRRCPS
jgi:hypothetical protein